MLNGGKLNAYAINNLAFSGAEGSGSLLDVAQYVAIIESGTLADVVQSVFVMGEGALVSLQQEIELRLDGGGVLVECAQTTISEGSGTEISIGQQVISATVPSFFDKNGWDAVVTLGNFIIPAEYIQDVEVVHSVNDDSRATIKLNPGAGAYDLYSYQGKTLSIDVRTTDIFERVFTGIVDIPRVEVVNEKLVIEGVSVRETYVRALMTPHVANIGYYSQTVFGPPSNVYQEVMDRMTTIPYDLDFDTYGNWSITSWIPKSAADIVLSDGDLYREQQPQVRIESAREVVNKVSIQLTYSYQRLHHASLSYSWNSGLAPCDLLTMGHTLPTREMIRSAANSAGWRLGTIGFTDLWASGWYRCNGVVIGWVNTRQDIIIRNSNATASGSNYSVSQSVASTDINTLVCLGAQWTCKKRFTQNIQETYTLTVNSPQSQTVYGVREKNENLAIQADFDTSQWEDPNLYDNEFSGTRVGASNNYYINADNKNAELSTSIVTILNKAKTDILRSHRDTEVSFTTFINPSYQLRHTVSLSTERIDTKGKVRSITHKFNAIGEATSSVSLALYRAVGSTSDSNLSPPARPAYASPASMGAVSLQSHWGLDPGSVSARKWNGYVGNKWVTVGGGFNRNTFKTTYQESFIVDTPAIPESRRAQQNYGISSSYNISIPIDSLTVTFVDS